MKRGILIGGLVAVICSIGFAQNWTTLNGPPGANTEAIEKGPLGDIYASGYGGYIYRSIDSGVTWVKVYSPPALTFENFFDFEIDDTGKIYAVGTSLLISQDGSTWIEKPLPSSASGAYIIKKDPVHGWLFITGSDNHLYKSINDGSNWTDVFSGSAITGLVITSAGSVIICDNGELQRSTSGGSSGSFSPSDSGLSFLNIFEMEIDGGGNIFLSDYENDILYVSDPLSDGSFWFSIPPPVSVGYGQLFTDNLGGMYFLTAFDGYIFQFNYTTTNWDSFIVSYPYYDYYHQIRFAPDNSMLYGAPAGIYRSDDGGASWLSSSSGLDHPDLSSLLVTDSDIILVGAYDGLYRSTNNGATFTQLSTYPVTSLFKTGGGTIFACGPLPLKSTNNGTSFNVIPSAPAIESIVSDGATLYGVNEQNLYYSTSNGNNWDPFPVNGMPTSYFAAYDYVTFNYAKVFKADHAGNLYWLVINDNTSSTEFYRINISTGNATQITSLPEPIQASGIETDANFVYFLGHDTPPYKLYFSSNQGDNWDFITVPGNAQSFRIANNGYWFIGSANDLDLSRDSGVTWEDISYDGESLNFNLQSVDFNSSGNAFVLNRFDLPITVVSLDDNTPPVIDVTAALSVSAGEAAVISATITDDETPISSATVTWRSINGSAPSQTTDLVFNGTDYSVTIPSNQIGELGLEYLISAGSSGGSIDDVWRNIQVRHTDGLNIPYSSFGSVQSNYRIIAVPLALDEASVNAVFNELGSYDKSKYRLFHYNGSTNAELAGGSSIDPGVGYWFIAKDNPGSINSGVGNTVWTFSDEPFEISLVNGWNQIGNPYNFNISWNDVKSANPGLGDLQTRDDTGAGYHIATQLKKMEGGFVFATPGTLSFPVTKNPTVNGGRVASKTPDAIDQSDWRVDLTIAQGEIENKISGFGMNSQAAVGFDSFDGFTLPRFGDYLELNYNKTEQGFAYTRDIIPTAENAIWEFSVESSLSNTQEVVLSWDNSYFGNNNLGLILWDVAQQRGIDMREQSSYHFNKSRSHDFRVFYGNAAFLREQAHVSSLVLYDIFPNPVNDATKISFSLPGTEHVMIDLLDMTGRKNGVLLDDTLEEGSHVITWKRGSQSAGMYIVKVKAGAGVAEKRLILK